MLREGFIIFISTRGAKRQVTVNTTCGETALLVKNFQKSLSPDGTPESFATEEERDRQLPKPGSKVVFFPSSSEEEIPWAVAA